MTAALVVTAVGLGLLGRAVAADRQAAMVRARATWAGGRSARLEQLGQTYRVAGLVLAGAGLILWAAS